MKREILLSVSPKEKWVALLEDDKLVELMFDRPDQGRVVGDIFLGRVEAVLPGIQAAFVDIGTGKAGFLHASDLERDEDEDDEDGNGGGNGDGNGRGRRPRKHTPIQDQLQKGDEIVVQVTKEPIGTKGPRLTAQVSLPGRFLVYMPYSSHVGVSRKIDDREERRRLKELARDVMPSDDGGVIIRTVGEELTRETFKREFQRLRDTWKKVQRRADSGTAPAEVHREAKLTSGVIRDLFSDKFDRLVIDDRDVYSEVVQYVGAVEPELKERIELYRGEEPLFDAFGIEEEIQKTFQPEVRLPSGGHIIIEPTEALVSIDVNTGKYTGKGKRDPEETILRTNLDAAREVARQLRLRDVGGIIVVDFIDMESQENRDRVFHEFKSHLGRDRARTRAFEVSELGLVEMTRQRVRPALYQALTDGCPCCGGSGRIFTPPTVARRIERSLRRVAAAGEEREIRIRTHPEVALYVLESEPDLLRRLADETDLDVELRDDPLLKHDEFRLLAGPAETDVTSRYTRR